MAWWCSDSVGVRGQHWDVKLAAGRVNGRLVQPESLGSTPKPEPVYSRLSLSLSTLHCIMRLPASASRPLALAGLMFPRLRARPDTLRLRLRIDH